jgi:hypothetical protein
VDEAELPRLRGQSGPATAIRPGVQPRQLPTAAGAAQGGEALDADPGAPGLREKLVKIGAKVVTHARYVIFQMAEVPIPRRLFAAILERIQRLRRPEVGVMPSG